MPQKILPFPAISRNRSISSRPAARSFTLIELLIAISIFSVVSIAVYSTFSSGLSVLRRVKDIDFLRQRVLIKEERFSRELRQMPALRTPLFSGGQEKISFAGLVEEEPCRITYYFDASAKVLLRVTDRLADILTKEGAVEAGFKSKPALFLAGIKEIKFSYLYFDLAKKAYAWAQEWRDNSVPLAVKLTVSTDNQNYATTTFFPAS